MGNNRPTLYVGFTSDLIQRVHAHKEGLVEGFTKKYVITKLLYYETTQDRDSALNREKILKKWKRAWKLNLIASINPAFKDLYPKICGIE